MILIADSGSTKCHWALCDEMGSIISNYKTIGFNPYFINEKKILNHLNESKLQKEKEKINTVFFYGAGCSSEEKNNIIKKPLELFFKNANIIIKHDIEAACYAMYNDSPNITCILGTGSNIAHFDGEKIKSNAPSLGFLIGDEASGNYFGKKLINLYFNNILPYELKKIFEKEYESNWEILMKNIYNNERANVYLAKYFPFITKHKNHTIIKDLIYSSLDEFFKIHICSYHDHQKVKVNFIGSVAYYLKDEIITVAKKYKCNIGCILQNPIQNLVKYHFKIT